MKKIYLNLFILLLAVASFSQSKEKRIALIIGNAAYIHGGALKNPVNDAILMATTLRSLGFEVIIKTNANLKSMQRATVDFTNKIANYEVALFFYAGHGIMVNGENYLIPVDAKLDDKASCQFEAFNINYINNAFHENQSHLNVMILDACRNNPFRSWMRGGSRGFKAVNNQAAGTIIAFATREGETASDGSGNNGLFTEKLIKQMKKSQNITEVFQNTRIEVLKASKNTQCPQEWNMLTGNFYFVKDFEQQQAIVDKNTSVVTNQYKNNSTINKITYSDEGKDLQSNAQFIITKGVYDINEVEKGVKLEFGDKYRVADWVDVQAYKNNIQYFVKKIGGMQAAESSLTVTRNGQNFFSGKRRYFITLHNHNKPSSYLAHDQIDKYYLSLGSWWGKRHVLCIKN